MTNIFTVIYTAVNKSGRTIANTTMMIITEDIIFLVFLLNIRPSFSHILSSDSCRFAVTEVLLKGYYI